MFNFVDVKLEKLIVHNVGNKSLEEGITFSQQLTKIEIPVVNELLLKYFLTPFKTAVFYNFSHDTNLALNELFTYTTSVFENQDEFYTQSVNIAKHLYEKSVHAKIKGGEFYVAYLSECLVGDDSFDAIGLFKTENKENFLKVKHQEKSFDVEYESGINTNKLDKGCLIFNTEKETGYKICIFDAVSKNSEAIYWKDDFLKVKPMEDEFFQTKNILALCKNFVEDVYIPENNVERTEQADFKTKTITYFAERDNFNVKDFEENVISSPEGISAFREYKKAYEDEQNLNIPDSFDISEQAVRNAKKQFKNILKLDKNFHVYIHGKKEWIEKGFDDARGLSYYQLYFQEEN